GGAVLQGPGCLNYSLILTIESTTTFASVTQTNCFIMKRHAEAVSALVNRPVAVQGFTDLVIEDRKFSGNSQRRRRHWLLFHGSFLLDLDLDLMELLLLPPSKQPSYRQNRCHREFLTHLQLPVESLKAALRRAWQASEAPPEITTAHTAQLVRDKY